MGRMTRHLTYQKQRYVTQLLRLACLESQCRDLRCVDFRDELTNTYGDLDPVLVKLHLPEHAGEYRTPHSLLRRNGLRRAALVRPYRGDMTQLQNVQLCHTPPPFFETM